MAGGLDDMAGVEGPCFGLAGRMRSREGNGPLMIRVRPGRRSEFCRCPDVEFKNLGIVFEPVGEFVLWCENRPVWGKGKIWEMVVPYWVMENELRVPR